MNRAWRRFTGQLIAPFVGVAFLFWAIRDGFIRQAITFRSDGETTTYTGSTAVLIGLGLVLGALLCALVTYRFWVIKDPVGPD
jgi:hypothetical protein